MWTKRRISFKRIFIELIPFSWKNSNCLLQTRWTSSANCTTAKILRCKPVCLPDRSSINYFLCLRLPIPGFYSKCWRFCWLQVFTSFDSGFQVLTALNQNFRQLLIFFLEQLVYTAMEDKVVNGKIKISIIPALEATRVLWETGKKN